VAVRPTLARLVRSRAAHLLAHPVVAAVPVVLGVHVLLLTPLLGASLSSGPVHGLVLAHTLLSGTWLAWALLGGDPAPPRSSLALRLVVLALVAGTHAHLATLLYARARVLPPGVPWSAADVQQAALVMYYAGDAAELLLAGVVVGAWYRAGTVRGRRRQAAPPRRALPQRIGRPPVTATLAPDM
jgi:putative membrane protein